VLDEFRKAVEEKPLTLAELNELTRPRS